MTTPTLASAGLTLAAPAVRGGAKRTFRRPMPITAFAVVPRQRKRFVPAPEPQEPETEARPGVLRRALAAVGSDLLSLFYTATDAIEFYWGSLCIAVAAIMFNWFLVGLLFGMALDHPFGMFTLLVGGVGTGIAGVQSVGNHRRMLAAQHRRICQYRTMMPEALVTGERL